MSLFVEEQTSTDAGPWPAFADLLAGTSLLFLVLFAAIALPALRKSAEASRRASTLQRVENDLRTSASANRVAIDRAGDYLVVRIQGNATFTVGASDLGSLRLEGKEILRRFGNVLLGGAQAPPRRIPPNAPLNLIDQIHVVGHTSIEGEERTNWNLSAARAATIALFLIDSVGIPACSVTALGRSHYYPVDTGFARTELRRVLTYGTPAAADSLDRRIELEVRPRIPGDADQARRRGACIDHP